MSLFKRQARRVAVVGVGVGLLVLGLEAPAFAAAPVVSSFTPASGPATGGCVLQVTGTSLDDFPAAATYVVEFVPTAGGTAIAAADYAIISDTELWVVSPATLTGGSDYFVRVTNPGGTNTSTSSFLATTGAGACAPTITKVTPSCGPVGTAVTITGTNLLMDVTATGGFAGTIGGGIVSFSPYTSDAAATVPNIDTATTLGRIVSTGAADGPIKVTTKGTTAAPVSGMSVFSTDKYLLPPPDCTEGLPFARGITLRLRDALVARGKVSASSATAPAGCTAAVPVKIQRRRAGGGWRTVGSTTTSDTGGYRKKIRNRHGKYRSLAPKLTLTTGEVCSRAVSKVVRH